jgi:cytochrome b6-f complex iron-sulfur subunit
MENEGRRKFLVICLAGATAAAAVAVAYPVFRYLAPRPGQPGVEKVVIATSDIPEGDAKFFEYAGSSAVVVKTKTGGLIVLSAVCTHLGCIVQWRPDKQDFLCPCHGGNFTADGVVISGPPPRPLPKIPFAVAEGKITIG